jgi:drug/metabolite transporter superfamily protein YnfA
MKIQPPFYLALAALWALAGGLNLWLWLGGGRPLNLVVALIFLVPLPLWILHYFRAKRGPAHGGQAG